MKIFIQASEMIMSKEEMQKRISPEKLEALKGKGILQAYTLAQEGKSQPKVLGEKSKVLTWTKSVIHRLAQKIKNGTKFFISHGKNTNSHDGRESVGEVLTSFVKDIGGKLSNIIIGHFPDTNKVKEADVCSMEADIETYNDVVDDVNNVSGVALGNSNIESPAFPGAFRLNTVQCFGESTTKKEGAKQMTREEVVRSLTFHEIKEATKSKNIFPWQLYSVEEMKDDKTFGKVFEQNSTLEAENERLKTQNTELETSSKDAIRANDINKSQKALDNLMQEGFTDKQRKFISDRFKPETLETLDEGSLKAHLETEKKVFADTAKLFGATEGSQEKSNNDSSNSTEDKSIEEEALEIMGV